MPIDRSNLEKLITDAFPNAQICLEDLRGDDDHWSIEIGSIAFEGKSRVQQHKMVYDALQGKMGGELHALQVKTYIPKGE